MLSLLCFHTSAGNVKACSQVKGSQRLCYTSSKTVLAASVAGVGQAFDGSSPTYLCRVDKIGATSKGGGAISPGTDK